MKIAWGRFKPWWASKKGLAFWGKLGETDLLKLFDFYEKGLGTGMDMAADAFGTTGSNNLPPPQILSSTEVQNQTMIMYVGGAILLYYILK